MRRDILLGVVVIVGVVALAALVWRAFEPSERTEPPGSARVSATRGKPDRAPSPVAPPTRRPDAPSVPEPPASAPDEPASDDSSEDNSDEIAAAWSAVDLEEVRKAMPDNLYWKLSLPTKDPRVLEEREAERARWNVEYGKVLSGTASEEEIRAYYDQRGRLSSDYIEFATYLVDHYGETLPPRDVGLLKLAMRLHHARLQEIPRKIEEAFERKRAQDAAREAWLSDQAIFGNADSGIDAE